MIEETKRYTIRPSRLVGSVHISGAKNSALRLLAASLLTSEKIEVDNYPGSLLDAQIHVEMLKQLGKECIVTEDKIIIIESGKIKSRLDWQGRSIRNTLLILGALVARTGCGAVPLPGGCDIDLGQRKYDLHEMVLRKMGAEVWTEGNMLCAEVKTRLQGADIYLPIRSTGATENAILCGSLAYGTTRLWNPHVRPEILDLINFLKSMGAKIEVYGLEHIEIQGVDYLSGTKHRTISDNVEAITWVIGSLLTNGDIEIKQFPFDALQIPLIYLRASGVKCYQSDQDLIVRGGKCYPLEISTGPYPSINSDFQPLFAVRALFAKGKSVIVDLRYPNRFSYAEEFKKMGADVTISEGILTINGGNSIRGRTVRATDLRTGVALALAGLVADGETIIEDAWQIDRGYNCFLEKMRSLGGSIIKSL